MIEHGVVVETSADRTIVELKRSAECGHCRACIRADGGKMRIELDAVPDVSVGDAVEVEVPVSRLKAILTVIVLPLAAVLLGALLGSRLTKLFFAETRFPNLAAIVVALVFVVATYVGLAIYERRRAGRQPRPTIRRVTPSGDRSQQ